MDDIKELNTIRIKSLNNDLINGLESIQRDISLIIENLKAVKSTNGMIYGSIALSVLAMVKNESEYETLLKQNLFRRQ